MEKEGVGVLWMRTAGRFPPMTVAGAGGSSMKRRLIVTISLSLSLGLGGIHGAALAQTSKEDLTATNGDAAARGNGTAAAAPGTVTRNGISGSSLLGPDGTYRVTEDSPPIVNV